MNINSSYQNSNNYQDHGHKALKNLTAAGCLIVSVATRDPVFDGLLSLSLFAVGAAAGLATWAKKDLTVSFNEKVANDKAQKIIGNKSIDQKNIISNSLSIPECSLPLQKYLRAILEIPEARGLINNIQEEGSIQIIADNSTLSKQFGAYWEAEGRIIYIDISERSPGYIFGSLLFELHNALVDSKFEHINQLAINGQIEKSHYVRSMEYLEYINSLDAAKITHKGIEMGVLPPESFLLTYSTFEEHFKVQIMGGHSAHFAQNYDLCRKYGLDN